MMKGEKSCEEKFWLGKLNIQSILYLIITDDDKGDGCLDDRPGLKF